MSKILKRDGLDRDPERDRRDSHVSDLAMRRVKHFDDKTILEAFSGYGTS